VGGKTLTREGSAEIVKRKRWMTPLENEFEVVMLDIYEQAKVSRLALAVLRV